jgi:hypothetical protein
LIEELLQSTSLVEKELRDMQKKLQMMPAAGPQSALPHAVPAPVQAILEGAQKYTDIPVPVLAIYAVPHDLGPAFPNDSAARAKLEADDVEVTEAQARAFEKGLPSAHVVRLLHASHHIVSSNKTDVLRRNLCVPQGPVINNLRENHADLTC